MAAGRWGLLQALLQILRILPFTTLRNSAMSRGRGEARIQRFRPVSTRFRWKIDEKYQSKNLEKLVFGEEAGIERISKANLESVGYWWALEIQCWMGFDARG